MRTMIRAVALAAAITITGSLAATSASAAPAVSSGCAVSDDCGSLQLAGGLVMQADSAHVGAAVVGAFASADPRQDFLRTTPPGGPAGAQTYELAPEGIGTGLCVSVPKAARQTKAVLRRCNDSHWQQFSPVASDTSPGFQTLISGASHQLVLTDPDGQHSNVQLQARRDRDGANQDWQFSDITTATTTAARRTVINFMMCDFKGTTPDKCLQFSQTNGTSVTNQNRNGLSNQAVEGVGPVNQCGGHVISGSPANGGCPFSTAALNDQFSNDVIANLVTQNTTNTHCVDGDVVGGAPLIGSCSGQNGTNWVIDGFSYINVFLSNNSGKAEYLTGGNAGNNVQVRNPFTEGYSQYAQVHQ